MSKLSKSDFVSIFFIESRDHRVVSRATFLALLRPTLHPLLRGRWRITWLPPSLARPKGNRWRPGSVQMGTLLTVFLEPRRVETWLTPPRKTTRRATSSSRRVEKWTDMPPLLALSFQTGMLDLSERRMESRSPMEPMDTLLPPMALWSQATDITMEVVAALDHCLDQALDQALRMDRSMGITRAVTLSFQIYISIFWGNVMIEILIHSVFF